MVRRLQIALTEEAWEAVDQAAKQVNENFDGGSVNFSDVINEMILTSKIDVKVLQLKHADLRRTLRAMAARSDLDLEAILRSLSELRSKPLKKRSTPATEGQPNA